MTLGSAIKSFFMATPREKPIDLQSFEDARRRLHQVVKSSASDIRKEVDAFSDMVSNMHSDRPKKPAMKKRKP